MSPTDQGENKVSLTKRILSLLLAGLATVIPIVGTVFLLGWIYKALLSVGRSLIYGIVRIMDRFRGVQYKEDQLGNLRPVEGTKVDGWMEGLEQLPQYIWFFVPIILLACVGLAVTNRPGQALSLIHI